MRRGGGGEDEKEKREGRKKRLLGEDPRVIFMVFSFYSQVLLILRLLLHKVPAIVSVWVRLVPLRLISGERVGPFLGLMESGDRRERVNWGQTVR
ncbi:hypothetical protein Pcinc_019410 [Petrolisthes cinctipes]|uniref:Transmembrane protein n=1 Tax=Petrolisthes cinctipes TaxID=88211 RepID=A0AAE1FLE3_PETCI|nr:hypothetical protein Pcinc_019410 [Petrolisthes cinctipes]